MPGWRNSVGSGPLMWMLSNATSTAWLNQHQRKGRLCESRLTDERPLVGPPGRARPALPRGGVIQGVQVRRARELHARALARRMARTRRARDARRRPAGRPHRREVDADPDPARGRRARAGNPGPRRAVRAVFAQTRRYQPDGLGGRDGAAVGLRGLRPVRVGGQDDRSPAVHAGSRQRGAGTQGRREVDAHSRQRPAPPAGKSLAGPYRPGAAARVGAVRRRWEPGGGWNQGEAHHGRSAHATRHRNNGDASRRSQGARVQLGWLRYAVATRRDRKSTRLNSSHDQISYAVFCLKKKTNYDESTEPELAVDRLVGTDPIVVRGMSRIVDGHTTCKRRAAYQPSGVRARHWQHPESPPL